MTRQQSSDLEYYNFKSIEPECLSGLEDFHQVELNSMTINTKAVSMKEILTAPWIEAKYFTSGKATMFVNPEHPHGYMHKSLDMAKGMYVDNTFIEIKIGDYVRWTCGPEWFDGTVKRIELNGAEVIVHDGSHGLKESKSITVLVSSLKHTERPPDVTYLKTTRTQTYTLADPTYAGGVKIVSDRTMKPQEILYDGLTAEQCLNYWERFQREDPSLRSIYRGRANIAMTVSQIAAAQELHSSKLRVKIAASKERERNRVIVDLQDEP